MKHMSSLNANQLSAMISQYDMNFEVAPRQVVESANHEKLQASDMIYPLEAYVHKE